MTILVVLRLVFRLLLALLALERSSAAVPWKKLLPNDNTNSNNNKRATACNVQMAKSLVAADEERQELTTARDQARSDHQQALAEVERLTQELHDNTADFTNRIDQLGKELQVATTEFEEMEEQFKEESGATIAQLGHDLQASQEETAATIAKMTKERQDAEATIKEESATALAALRAEMVKLRDEKEVEIQQLHTESARRLAEKEQQMNKLKVQKEREIKRLHNELSEEKEVVVKELIGKKERIRQEHEQEKKGLEKNHSKLVNQLKTEMETKEKQAVNQIKAREMELESKMEKLQREAQKFIEEKEGNYSKQVKELITSMEKLQGDHSKLEEHITELEAKYAEASKEVEEWQATFRARSYCNLTHIQEDTTATVAAAAAAASKIASEQVGIASRVASRAAEPHIATSRQYLNKKYEEHLKETVDGHLSPFYESRLQPMVRTVSDVVMRRGWDFMKHKVVFQSRQYLIDEFTNSCSGFHDYIRDANFPTWVVRFVNQKCQEPQQTMDRFLWSVVLLFVLVFRRTLYRTMKRILYFPFRVLWYMTPLPLLFGRRKKKNNQQQQQSLTNIKSED